MRDTVQIHVTADLPIRVRALTYANRAEIRFGKAFPVVLLVDSDAIAVLSSGGPDRRSPGASAGGRGDG